MRSRRQHERGFALLLVFAMAAAVLLVLYTEMPRAVFESARNKEGLLVERGEQYQMAIRRYFKKFQRYPQTLDELDKTNGMRFLRRRYVDPFTGKAEWKIIKMDAAGNLIDSVQNKKKGPLDKDDEKKGSTGAVVALSGLGDMNQGPNADGERTNIALQRRGSDRGVGGELAMQQYQQQQQGGGAPDDEQRRALMAGVFGGSIRQPGQQGQPGQPGQQQQGPPEWARVPDTPPQPQPGVWDGTGTPPPQYLLPPGPRPPVDPQPAPQQMPQMPQFPPGFQLPGMVPGMQQQMPQQGGRPPFPPQGQQQPVGQQQGGVQQGSSGSVMALPGLGQAFTPPGQNPNQRPGTGFNPGQQLPGAPTAGSGVANSQGGVGGIGGTNQAVNQIMNGLLNPNGRQPGGVPGMAGAMGGGIVGIASKYKAEGIKVIEERTKIHEWEFIYDFRKDKKGQAGVPGMPGGANPLGGAPPAGSAPTGTATKK